MPHITLNSDDPGIRGLLRYRPETARPTADPRPAEPRPAEPRPQA
jgi:hypothetical protein